MRTAIAFFPLLLLLLIGAAIALIYFIMYKRKINRIVMSQNDTDDPEALTARDAAGPEPSSVADKLFKAGAVIIILILLIKLSNANNSLNSLSNSVSALTRDVQQLQISLNSFSADTAAAESLLSSYDFAIGELHSEDNTIDLKLYATPKTSPADTKVSVSLGHYSADLIRETGSTYTGVMRVGLFDQLSDCFTFYIADGDSTVSEVCESYLGIIWPKILPTAAVMTNGSFSAGTKIDLDLETDVQLNNSEFVSFNRSGIRMTETLGNEVLADRDVSSDVTWNDNFGTYHISLDKKLTNSANRDYSIKLFAEDSAGYRHEIQVISVSEHSGQISSFLNEKIYDASGNLVNEDTYSIY